MVSHGPALRGLQDDGGAAYLGLEGRLRTWQAGRDSQQAAGHAVADVTDTQHERRGAGRGSAAVEVIEDRLVHSRHARDRHVTVLGL